MSEQELPAVRFTHDEVVYTPGRGERPLMVDQLGFFAGAARLSEGCRDR